MKYLFIIAISLLFNILHGQSFSLDVAKLDQFFDTLDTKEQAMGSLCIMKDGKTLYTKAIGYAEYPKQESSAYGLYRIGSISKTYTAAIIMQLVDESKLTLETPLSKYYPQIANASDITIDLLLRHRSGLINFTNDESYMQTLDQYHSKDDLLQLFYKYGANSKPNEQFEYCNTNYVLLTFIIEDIEKSTFSQVFDQRISKKLHLPNTYVGLTNNSRPQEVNSYEYLGQWKESTHTDLSIPLGAGSVISTAEEVAMFFHLLASGKVVSEDALSKMSSFKDGYGYGLFIMPFYDKMGKGHNGGIDGFSTSAAFFDDGTTIAYLSNGVRYPLNDILIGILSIYYDKLYDIPSFLPSIVVDEAILKNYVGTYGADAFPLDIRFKIENGTLVGQATGQSSFPMDAVTNTLFKFEPANLTMEFLPSGDEVKMVQYGRTTQLIRKK